MQKRPAKRYSFCFPPDFFAKVGGSHSNQTNLRAIIQAVKYFQKLFS